MSMSKPEFSKTYRAFLQILRQVTREFKLVLSSAPTR